MLCCARRQRQRVAHVEDASGCKKLIAFRSYKTLVKNCKEHFSIDAKENIRFVKAGDQYEVTEDTLLSLPADCRLLVLISRTVQKASVSVSEPVCESSIQLRDVMSTQPPANRRKSLTSCNPQASQTNAKSPDDQTITPPSDEVPDFTEASTSTMDGQSGSPHETEDRYIDLDTEQPGNKGLISYIKAHGLANIEERLKQSLDEWKAVPLNIAVTGSSGTGKSSLINSLRNLRDYDILAADVGEVETTAARKSYPHPHYKQVLLWDLPGVGTPNCPREGYMEAVKFKEYDFFLICSSERFTENDQWLADEINARNKRFYFVRTKIDIDVTNACRRNKTEEFTLIKIRNNCFQKGTSEKNVFLISNLQRLAYDFPKLLSALIRDIPFEKREALTFSLLALSTELVEEKVNFLKARIWKVALASGFGAIIPIPGVSTMFDVAIILNEVLTYREQFGLDEGSLATMAEMAGVDIRTLKIESNLNTSEDSYTAAGITAYIMQYAAREITEKLVYWFIPFIGTAIGSGISYSTTYAILEALLEEMSDDALTLLKYVKGKKTNNGLVLLNPGLEGVSGS